MQAGSWLMVHHRHFSCYLRCVNLRMPLVQKVQSGKLDGEEKPMFLTFDVRCYSQFIIFSFLWVYMWCSFGSVLGQF